MAYHAGAELANLNAIRSTRSSRITTVLPVHMSPDPSAGIRPTTKECVLSSVITGQAK